MHTLLQRLGAGAASRPWRTIAAWLAALAVAFGLAAAFGGTTRDNYDVPDARAQVGIEQTRAHFPETGTAGATAQVVVRDDATLSEGALAELTGRLLALDHVTAVTPPRLSADARTALLTVSYDVPVTDPDLADIEPLEDAVAPLRDRGVEVELGGELPGNVAGAMSGRGELIGILAALVILVLAFGSVVAAGLPVAVAVTGLALGTAGVTVLASLMDVSATAPTIATMVGLGVGIDYALLLVTRHTEFLRAGLPVPAAAGRAVATAGRSVVFAGTTVLVSLLGLGLTGLPVYSSFGLATGIAVVAVMAAAVTLVPALCGLAGTRLLPRRVRRGQAARTEPLTARWARRVGRSPLPFAVVATLVLLVLAAPVLDMRTWPQDGGSKAADTTVRKAYDIVAESYGPGANAPLTFVVDRERLGDDGVARVHDQVAAHDGIVAVTDPVVSPDGELAVFDAQPARAPADAGTGELIAALRADVSDAEVTGNTALLADISDLLAQRIWLVIGFVVALSVVLLTAVFRSVVVSAKAAVMNLLSIAASYGVLTAVFQWGWGRELLGVDHAMPVSTWVPILMFAVLFGLSMDYEVFLLSRVREDWLATGDARGSVERGLAGTGRVISAAAAIMVAVFLGFATEAEVIVKMLGFGMAVAILLDATLVRMVLVPATMALLGRWNWWLPAWLDRLLPRLDVEGPGTLAPERGAVAGAETLGERSRSL